jgi:hypothetical protein
LKQPVDTVNHVFVRYKLATAGLLDASLHSCDEAVLIFEHAGNSVFHQLLGVPAMLRRGIDITGFNLAQLTQFTVGWTGARIEQRVISAITCH